MGWEILAMNNWRTLIGDEMREHGDSFEKVESLTLSKEELDRQFDEECSLPEGPRFTLWTKSRVYFPVVDDAGVCCGSVSRKPDGLPTPHIGWSTE
jgi:hypothetical protein